MCTLSFLFSKLTKYHCFKSDMFVTRGNQNHNHVIIASVMCDFLLQMTIPVRRKKRKRLWQTAWSWKKKVLTSQIIKNANKHISPCWPMCFQCISKNLIIVLLLHCYVMYCKSQSSSSNLSWQCMGVIAFPAKMFCAINVSSPLSFCKMNYNFQIQCKWCMKFDSLSC